MILLAVQFQLSNIGRIMELDDHYFSKQHRNNFCSQMSSMGIKSVGKRIMRNIIFI